MLFKNKLGGVEIPIDKYFKDKNINDLSLYVNSLKQSNLRLIYAFENFDSTYFNQLAPFIRKNNVDFIRVKISNFYENKFIVESVNVEFSKEMTEDGPLYVDIEMVMSGIEIATKGRTGLLDNRYSANSSRIKITD